MPIKTLEIIGANFGWGAKRYETELGPKALMDFGLLSALQKKDPKILWRNLEHPISAAPENKLDFEQRLAQVHSFCEKLANIVHEDYKTHFPVVVGGDNSISIGTWSGVVGALNGRGQFGLIWIDAHMDAHTRETTPSFAIHGMPLAVLMGHGDLSLVNIRGEGAKLSPQHVVLIGVRSFEEGEAQLLKRLNVKIYFMDEVKNRGFDSVFQEAVEKVSIAPMGFGVSLDIDAIDPLLAPGTGAPVPDGLHDGDLVSAFMQLAHNPQLKAVEITEFNPILDKEDRTAAIVQRLILSLLE